MSASLGVGLIGSGKHGSRYAAHLRCDVPGLHLTAISRRGADGARQAADWGCVWYPDWRELVHDPRVEAVIAVTLPVLNLEIARACARAGKALLVEKPLAADRAVGSEMLRRCDEAGIPLTVGQTLRYNEVILGLREQLAAIGELQSFAACQRLEPSPLPWHDVPAAAGAGVSIHTLVHVFDALRYVTGKNIRAVMASALCRHSQRLEDQVCALVELEDGVQGVVDGGKLGASRCGRIELVGHLGQLQGDHIHHELELLHGNRRESLPLPPPGPTIVPLLRDWQRFLQGLGPNPVPGTEGLAALAACEACLTSSRSRAWEEVR
ncbi:MAG: hypothetical protein BWK76_06175 [Desulfobulbaceae bacterium A2]|nr:MAG: hypothetical protein BWK76_06175 [Desulfobulbaceae bacterium A2]